MSDKGLSGPGAALSRVMMWKGAIASVALSHEVNHDCDACKAARGDEAAFARVVAALEASKP